MLLEELKLRLLMVAVLLVVGSQLGEAGRRLERDVDRLLERALEWALEEERARQPQGLSAGDQQDPIGPDGGAHRWAAEAAGRGPLGARAWDRAPAEGGERERRQPNGGIARLMSGPLKGMDTRSALNSLSSLLDAENPLRLSQAYTPKQWSTARGFGKRSGGPLGRRLLDS